MNLEPGMVVGNKKVISLHSKTGDFERWKCQCLLCGKIHYYAKTTIQAKRVSQHCTACRYNHCPEFNSIKGNLAKYE